MSGKSCVTRELQVRSDATLKARCESVLYVVQLHRHVTSRPIRLV